jgi:polyphosphate kinase 2 (PPK2 family)
VEPRLRQINRFEQMLVDDGTILIKFYLTSARTATLPVPFQGDPLKQWKITDEDWRNRESGGAQQAAEDMFAVTASDRAPWCIIASNDKVVLIAS